jgi:hypothetical protein
MVSKFSLTLYYHRTLVHVLDFRTGIQERQNERRVRYREQTNTLVHRRKVLRFHVEKRLGHEAIWNWKKLDTVRLVQPKRRTQRN